jgi:NAD(P)-dependent dehydrogenase (short-subunit alcohol dehydrogenase family)
MSSILITGANRGIGLELTRCFAQDDWRVFACCRNPEQTDELHALAAKNNKLSIHRLEVTDRAQISELAEALKAETIDILLNNAGIFGPEKQGFGETDRDDWLETFHVNCIAPMMITEAFVEMVARSRLRIIAAMGSVMGSIAENSSGNHYAYRTSKVSVHMVIKGLSLDLADRGIITVALHPGWVRTRMGGTDALLGADVSAQGLKKVLLGLSIEDSGCLIDSLGEKRVW